MNRPLSASKRPLARSATRSATADTGRYADSGIWARSGRWTRSESGQFVMSVCTMPGLIANTDTPVPVSSAATDDARCETAALLAP